LWASQHLDNLWGLEAHLGERVNTGRPEPAEASVLGRLRVLAS
jgi:hypothetical protein